MLTRARPDSSTQMLQLRTHLTERTTTVYTIMIWLCCVFDRVCTSYRATCCLGMPTPEVLRDKNLHVMTYIWTDLPSQGTARHSLCLTLPKVELHAHLNGSVRHATLQELAGGSAEVTKLTSRGEAQDRSSQPLVATCSAPQLCLSATTRCNEAQLSLQVTGPWPAASSSLM